MVSFLLGAADGPCFVKPNASRFPSTRAGDRRAGARRVCSAVAGAPGRRPWGRTRRGSAGRGGAPDAGAGRGGAGGRGSAETGGPSLASPLGPAGDTVASRVWPAAGSSWLAPLFPHLGLHVADGRRIAVVAPLFSPGRFLSAPRGRRLGVERRSGQ